MSIRAERVVRLLIRTTWIGLLGLALALLIGTRVASMDGRSVLIIRGGSMEPALPLGSLVVVEPVDPRTLSVSDVVAFRAGPGTLVTHRITQVFGGASEPRFETRGDANLTPDPVLATASAIVGRVVVTVPLAGYALAYLSLPGGMPSFLALIGMLFLAGWLIDVLERERTGAPAPAATQPQTAANT